MSGFRNGVQGMRTAKIKDNRFALTFGQYRLQPKARKLLTAFVKHTGFRCCLRKALSLTYRDNLFLYLTEETFSGFARLKDIPAGRLGFLPQQCHAEPSWILAV